MAESTSGGLLTLGTNGVGVLFVIVSPFLSLAWLTPLAVVSLAAATAVFACTPVEYKRQHAEGTSAAYAVAAGLGCVVALHHRASTLYRLLVFHMRDLVPLFMKRQRDRTLGRGWARRRGDTNSRGLSTTQSRAVM